MSIRSFPSALLLGILAGLPIAATSTAQSNPAAVSLPGDTRSPQTVAGKTPTPDASRKVAANYGKLPISFEANHGQTDKRVKFVARGSGYGLYLSGNEAVLALHAPQSKETPSGTDPLAKSHPLPSVKTDIVRMQLRNANPAAQPVGIDALPGTANYFVGKDPSQWHTDIPTYSRVKFSAVYPGIDLVYYGNQSQLEYDFVVAPKADAKAIKLHFAGASKLALSANGDLSISAKDGQIAFHKPVIYQEAGGQRQPVEGRFILLANNSVGFTLGRYDRSQPLVIDPLLVYSTYLGGYDTDGGNAIAVDGSGNAYVTGFMSRNDDFPVTPGAFQTVDNADDSTTNAYIAKLNPAGTALLYSTYLGGDGTDSPSSIAIDGQGNAYITGTAGSHNFPVTPGAFQTVNKGVEYLAGNAFVTKLNPAGTKLVYSTYLGGSYIDEASSIAIDGQGNAYVAGISFSDDFPVTPGAFQTVNNGTANRGTNAFVTKLNPTGTGLVYSTYLGGSFNDGAYSIAIDGQGNAYVAGGATSQDFPVTPGAFQTTKKAYIDSGFVAKLNSAGVSLLYSTFLGGSGSTGLGDSVSGIAVDGTGNAYVAGDAYSPDFPVTPGAFQTVSKSASQTGFVTKLNPAGAELVYSTYLGGSGSSAGYGDSPTAIVLDDTGSAYVTGVTASTDFPVADALQGTNDAYLPKTSGYVPFMGTAFVTKLDPSGAELLFSTYLGGSREDTANGIALDNDGNVYVIGETTSTDFPVTPGAFLTKNRAYYGNTGFVSKLDLKDPSSLTSTVTTLTTGGNTQTAGVPIKFSATVAGLDNGLTPTGNVVFSVGGTPVATVPLDLGAAVWETSTLSPGTHPVRASFLGGPNFRPSSAIQFETIVFPLIDFAPKSGQYDVNQLTVTLSPNPPNSTIYYTLDGSTPTAASPVYTGALTLHPGFVPGPTTIAAREVLSDGSLSLVSEATYDIVPPTPTPIFQPASGSYPAGQQITITSAIFPTVDVSIYYTTDGSVPTTKSTVYTGPITLNPGSETIRAIATFSANPPHAPSVVNSATYTTP